MLTTMRMWSVAPLSVRARVTLVKSLIWSRAWFLANYRRMPDRLRDLLWGATVYYVVKGQAPKDFSFDGQGRAAPRVTIPRALIGRPTHFGGLNMWSPRLHMVSQSVKAIKGLQTPVYRRGGMPAHLQGAVGSRADSPGGGGEHLGADAAVEDSQHA